MATVTIQITAGGNTVGRNKTVSGTDLTRLLNAYRAILGQVSDGAGGFRDMTDDETVLAWADGLLAGTKANVDRNDQEAAAKTAKTGVPAFTFT